jgi:hypothetical protein
MRRVLRDVQEKIALGFKDLTRPIATVRRIIAWTNLFANIRCLTNREALE